MLRGLDTGAALQERVFSTGTHKSTHRCPDTNDKRLQDMIPPPLPDLLAEFTKAVRRAHPATAEEVLRFSAGYFAEMAARQSTTT
ncbi:hypothetical protein KFE25_002313 [Diacronema lutheri]|uniref:RIIa domain-containing protein n=1 Tax=Diacronema lutheri TaxID=2081491 RepID=A0A8J5X4L8_DIALT|nr:hypothetical protein KFE25_002313 [Diacronema lutheri]